jgi:hypothetical protein
MLLCSQLGFSRGRSISLIRSCGDAVLHAAAEESLLKGIAVMVASDGILALWSAVRAAT